MNKMKRGMKLAIAHTFASGHATLRHARAVNDAGVSAPNAQAIARSRQGGARTATVQEEEDE
jgi:hypothetical protein